ncbi:Fe3+-hydroxamate ABC transporter substrate-binding protein [Cutibacterium acnes]
MPGALVIGESLIDVVNDGAQGVSILGVPDECRDYRLPHRRIRVTEDSSPPRQCLRDWHHEGELPLDL